MIDPQFKMENELQSRRVSHHERKGRQNLEENTDANKIRMGPIDMNPRVSLMLEIERTIAITSETIDLPRFREYRLKVRL